MKFAYENLEVWDKSIEFAVTVINTVEEISTDRKHYRLLEQIEASSTSISMNIAEGKGRYSKKEFTHYLYIARGSLYETMTLLQIFLRIGWITERQYKGIEASGIEIASMIKGLIKSLN
ncbi:MAG TPA: four helix bundle protein [Deltaproteobacteria bacterium]|nr:four helix bundle protein [Deltaproteobacteria bacterium]